MIIESCRNARCLTPLYTGKCKQECIKRWERELGKNQKDFVEVVRCKDCKHMKIDRNGYRWCLVWTGINGMGDDGFCNYGERKDND